MLMRPNAFYEHRVFGRLSGPAPILVTNRIPGCFDVGSTEEMHRDRAALRNDGEIDGDPDDEEARDGRKK